MDNKGYLDEKYKKAREQESIGNYSEYIEILFELAKQGHAESQLEIGWIYMSGLYNFKRDLDKSLYWHLKAENSGIAENFFSLGILYEMDVADSKKSFSTNLKLSKKYYLQAFDAFLTRANQGELRAIYRVGEMYVSGLGVEIDHKKAEFWFKKYKEIGDSKEKE